MSFRYVVVDDAPFMREIMKNILGSMGGLCVGETAEGETAAELVNKTLPDLVILDLVLPKLNGIEVARQIRQINLEVKIIACSTLEDNNIRENAIDAGCNDFVAKPFEKDQFTFLVKEYFGPIKEKIP